MSLIPIVLIGGGGHCKSVIDVIECEGKFGVQGILDMPEKIGTVILGYPVIGTDADIDIWMEKGCWMIITLGQIKSAERRREIFELLKKKEAKIATVVSPFAKVSKHTQVGIGNVILHKACINADVIIGDNNIFNTGCNIEHDVKIESHCHISTHAVVNGNCEIGDGVFIGSNSVLSNNINIGNNVVIGAGSVIHKSIEGQGTYIGNPFKKVR